MPLDAIFLSGLTKELSAKLEGGRIDKVQQPERDVLVLSIRSQGENFRLLLSCATGSARVQLTQASFENPAQAPMFCMLMRKHLIGAHIARIWQPERDRLLMIELDCRDEMGFASSKKLAVELIGRSSNIVLIDSEGRILDCMRRTEGAGESPRPMLPGLIYRLPPKQDKPHILDTISEQRRQMLSGADDSRPLDKILLDLFAGLSPLVCRELSYRCGGDIEAAPAQLDAFTEAVAAGELAPCILYEEGKARDLSFMEIHQYGASMELQHWDGYSALLDAFYAQREKAEYQRRRGAQLRKQVRTLRDRQERKLAGQKQELLRTEGRDELRRNAELITANIYRIKRGDRQLECIDYYDPDYPTVVLELDPMRSPQQNAAALFKEYNKLKTAKEHLTKLIAQGEEQLEYLCRVLELIDQAESEKDLGDIRRELKDTGFIRRQGSGKGERGKPQGPMRFVTEDGFEVLAGRSNLQNDELSTKIGRRTDYWLHTQKIHGSHVILRCNDEKPSELALEQAASIAAYYSQARDGGKVPVDYCMLRYVKKPSGSMPGKVIYTDYRTIFAKPDQELIERLRK